MARASFTERATADEVRELLKAGALDQRGSEPLTAPNKVGHVRRNGDTRAKELQRVIVFSLAMKDPRTHRRRRHINASRGNGNER